MPRKDSTQVKMPGADGRQAVGNPAKKIPMSPGIQNLTLLLSAALVVLTGAIVASLAIASGNDSTNDARDTGDESVEGCFEAGEDNVGEVANRLLRSILTGTESSLKSYTDVPDMAADSVMHFLRNHPPDLTNSPAWMNDTLRGLLAGYQQELAPHGLRSVAYEALPFAANADSDHWGGTFYLLVGNELMDGVPDDEMHFVAAETRNDITGLLDYNTGFAHMGTADSRGFIDTRNGTELGCNTTVLRHPQGDNVIGLCKISWQAVKDADWYELENRILYNAEHDDGSLLLEADKKWWSPIQGSVEYSWVHVYASWTHPEMPNVWGPRQGNRVGYVKFSLSTEGIRAIVEQQVLPADSLLYIIERNPWTKEVGTLIGFNAGIIQNTTNLHKISFYNVTEYPKHDEVRNHGLHVFANGGYQQAVNRERFLTYTGVNGTTYWWQVSLLSNDGDLGWYVVLLIPRAEIMRNIDAKTRVIKAETDAARREADDKRRNNFVILMVVIVTSAVVLLLGSFYMSKKIITPLLDLERDMSNVALMRLDMVNLRKPLSYLHEVRRMQSSFKQMVTNLAEYRNYLPQAALVTTDSGDDDDDDDVSNASSKLAASHPSELGSNASRHSHAVMHYMTTGIMDSRGSASLVEGVRKKSVSILLFNCCNWHRMMVERDTEACLATLSELLLLLLESVQESNGVAELFSGDRLWANFNAARPLSSHRVSCATAGVIARTKMAGRKGMPKLSFAACSGAAKVGNVGCAGMKKFSVFSTAVPWAAALERVNKEKECEGMCDLWVAKDADTKLTLRCIDLVVYPKRMVEPIRVYEVVGLQSKVEQDWMYHIRDGSLTHVQTWNKAMEAVFAHDWPGAAAHLESFTGEKDNMYARLQHIITEQTYAPITVMRL
ncbi:hypothetical protein DIPPA_35529 [Diplonema papillatum]|nr:hypothetical protein DIPPA_35529 [Diplonema papillatum]